MRCVSKIRADGVAPVPVADACQHSHKDGPNTRRPHQSSRVADAHQPKNARESEGGALRRGDWGRSPVWGRDSGLKTRAV